MAPGFSEFDRRNSPLDGAYYLYLHTPKREPNVIQQRLSILESHKRTARFLYRGPAIQTQRRRKLVGRLRWSARSRPGPHRDIDRGIQLGGLQTTRDSRVVQADEFFANFPPVQPPLTERQAFYLRLSCTRQGQHADDQPEKESVISPYSICSRTPSRTTTVKACTDAWS